MPLNVFWHTNNAFCTAVLPVDSKLILIPLSFLIFFNLIDFYYSVVFSPLNTLNVSGLFVSLAGCSDGCDGPAKQKLFVFLFFF